MFNYTATTYSYTYCHTLSLHDALPIYVSRLWQDRHEEADSEFASFTFPTEVVESSGWDYTMPGNEMTKTVFLESPAGEDSIAAKFVVIFDEEIGRAHV